MQRPWALAGAAATRTYRAQKGPVDGDLPAARATLAAGIERLLPSAAEHGVRLGIERLHPIDGRRALGDRPARRGARADGLVGAHHVLRWTLVPTTDLPVGRGPTGDGIMTSRACAAWSRRVRVVPGRRRVVGVSLTDLPDEPAAVERHHC